MVGGRKGGREGGRRRERENKRLILRNWLEQVSELACFKFIEQADSSLETQVRVDVLVLSVTAENSGRFSMLSSGGRIPS